LKVIVSRGCTDVTKESEYGCQTHKAGTHMFTFCNCHDDSCNKDWTSAAGAPVKCYDCNSLAPGDVGNCSDANPGVLVECPIDKRRGCYISQASYGSEKKVYERGCTEVSDPGEYKCQDVGKEGQGLHYCNCQGNGCNKDWTTAGVDHAVLTLVVLSSLLLVTTIF